MYDVDVSSGGAVELFDFRVEGVATERHRLILEAEADLRKVFEVRERIISELDQKFEFELIQSPKTKFILTTTQCFLLLSFPPSYYTELMQ